MSSIIFFFSSGSQILGTSPEFSKPLMSSKKDSFTIYVSVKRNVTSFPSIPVCNLSVLIKSLKLIILYPFTISMLLFWQLSIKLERRVSDCFPEPPTPISMAQPLGYLKTLAILYFNKIILLTLKRDQLPRQKISVWPNFCLPNSHPTFRPALLLVY